MVAKEMYNRAQEVAKESEAAQKKLKEHRLSAAMTHIRVAADQGRMQVRISMPPDSLTEEVLAENGFKVTRGSRYDQRDQTGSSYIDVSWAHPAIANPRGV